MADHESGDGEAGPVAGELAVDSEPWGRLVTLNRENKHIKLTSSKTTFGRKECDHNFPGIQLLSSKHCRIVRKDLDPGEVDASGVDFAVEVVDLSTNGTFINGMKIGKKNRATLRHGDELFLCDSVAYVYTHLKLNSGEPGAGPSEGLSSVADFVSALRAAPSLGVLKDLALTLQLTKASDEANFLDDFVEADGTSSLVATLSRLNAKAKKSKTDIDSLMECIKALYALMNHPGGFEQVLECAGAVDELVLLLDVASTELRSKVLKLLVPICTISEAGHDLVLAGFSNFRVKRREHVRFLRLTELLGAQFSDAFTDDDVSLKRNVLMLINGIISQSDELTVRVQLRDEFLALGMLDTLAMLKNVNHEGLSVQLEAFLTEYEADRREASVGAVNLSDPVHLAATLLIALRGTECAKRYLDCMLCLVALGSAPAAWDKVAAAVRREAESALEEGGRTDVGIDLEHVRAALADSSVISDLSMRLLNSAGSASAPGVPSAASSAPATGTAAAGAAAAASPSGARSAGAGGAAASGASDMAAYQAQLAALQSETEQLRVALRAAQQQAASATPSSAVPAPSAPPAPAPPPAPTGGPPPPPPPAPPAPPHSPQPLPPSLQQWSYSSRLPLPPSNWRAEPPR